VLRSAEARGNAAAQVAVKIDGEVEAVSAKPGDEVANLPGQRRPPAQPAQAVKPFALGQGDHLVQTRRAGKHLGPSGFDQPGEVRFGIGRAQRVQRRQGMDHIAQPAQSHNADFFRLQHGCDYSMFGGKGNARRLRRADFAPAGGKALASGRGPIP